MVRILLTGIALVAPAALMAQQATDTAPVPAQTMPSTTMPTDSSATGTAAGTTATGGTAATGTQVAAVVEQEFPTYDADKSGQLDKTEFSKWVLDLKSKELQATGKTATSTELTAWASAAFTTADADKNKSVNKTELTKYLGG